MAYRKEDGSTVSEGADHLQNDSRTCEPRDTGVTQPRSPPVRGYVYFIRSGDFIKIGFSTRPLDRLAALQTSHHGKLEIVGTRKASRHMEIELHEHFKDLRVRGEWFQAKAPLLRYIEQNTPEGIAAAKAHRLNGLNNLGRAPHHTLSEEAKATVARLINHRFAIGALAPAGHRCSNLAEMLPNYEAAESADQRRHLAASIAKQVRELATLSAMNAEDRGAEA